MKRPEKLGQAVSPTIGSEGFLKLSEAIMKGRILGIMDPIGWTASPP